jgi:hypothetical protein
MGFAAITLAVMSFLHLSGTLSGGPEPFNRTHAGIAEALICVALSSGGTMLSRESAHARGVALASVVFAILGFIVGAPRGRSSLRACRRCPFRTSV